jgi:uncharacterized membrane protein
MNLLTWHAPWYLLAIPPILVALWWWSRQPGLPYPRRLVVLLMRMTSVVLLVMALAAPSWQIPPRAVALVVVRDVSASIDATALQRQATLITQLQASQPATALLGIVDVASTVAVAAIPSPALRDTSPAVVANRDATALAAAVTQAAALLPAGYEGRLLVLSDGQETRGRLRDTITALVARGIRVDVIPLTTTQPPAQAALTQVRLPQQTRGSGTLIADIDTTGSVAQSAILRVTNNGMPFFETTLQLPGSAQRVALTIPPIDPGMHRLEFTLLAPQDDALPDNRQRVLVQRDGALQILVLADPVDPIQPFVTMVRASGSTVTVRRPSDIDSQLSTLAGYDVIVLADTPARLVPPIVMQNIVRAVKTLGRGFLWLGGSQSLGAGGFRYTPLAEIAPVQFDPIDPTKRKRLAVLLIIDKSGSMADAVGGGLSRLDLAKEAAYQAIQGLSDGDTVGVGFFSDSAQWSLVPQPVPSADSVAQALGVVQSDGGTSIRSGLQLAQASIATLDGDVRHVMLLSDGQDPQSSRDIAQAFANQSVSLSTIALGADADMQGLSQLARIGQGVSYQVTNPQDLARVFLDETTRVASRDFVEADVMPQLVSRDAWPAGNPPVEVLHGYNRTTTRANARVLMQIDADNPLWVIQQAGAGQSAVWASDLSQRWGRDWLTSPAFAALVPALLAPLIPTAPSAMTLAWYWHDDLLDVEVTTDAPTTTAPSAQLIAPDGNGIPIVLTQRDARLWRASVADIPNGEYVLTVRSGETLVTRGVVITQRSELLNDGQGSATLSAIAQQTAGQINPALTTAYWQVRGGAQFGSLSLVPYLVLMSMALFVGEIALRRLNIRLMPAIRLRGAAVPPPPTPPAPPTITPAPPPSRIDRLQQAKRRASASDDTHV